MIHGRKGAHGVENSSFLREQCARYPALRPQDLLKAIHQSVFGCGHFVADEAEAAARLWRELETVTPTGGPDAERLGGNFGRVHLRACFRLGLSAETLLKLFVLSAREKCGSDLSAEALLEEALTLTRGGALSFGYEEMAAAAEEWRRAGYPLCRHSEAFRAAYAPAYRVVRWEMAWALPLFAAIDRKLAENGRVVLAIEGGAGSGKTTLADLLRRVYGAVVFHMDDFFLRPEQRTAARLAEPGGNVDRERFLEEVLGPLSRSTGVVRYRPYDCAVQALAEPVEVSPAALTVVEGAYSMHPALADHYDLSVFLRQTPEIQRRRILHRNGAAAAERFFSVWIPMEDRYFEAFDTADRCDLILEVEP